MANTDLYSNAFADNFRFGRSKTFVGQAAGTYNAIRIPKFAFVTDVWVKVTTAFTSGGLLDVGFLGNGETADPNFFVEGVLLTVAGVTRSSLEGLPGSGGKWFNGGSGVITFTYDDTAVTVVGACIVFCSFSVIV